MFAGLRAASGRTCLQGGAGSHAAPQGSADQVDSVGRSAPRSALPSTSLGACSNVSSGRHHSQRPPLHPSRTGSDSTFRSGPAATGRRFPGEGWPRRWRGGTVATTAGAASTKTTKAYCNKFPGDAYAAILDFCADCARVRCRRPAFREAAEGPVRCPEWEDPHRACALAACRRSWPRAWPWLHGAMR